MKFLNIIRLISDVTRKVSVSKTITGDDVRRFAELSGDTNPIHSSTSQQKAIVHGAFLNALVSRVMGTELPGPGSMLVSQTLNFPNKCYVGDTVKVSVEVIQPRKIMEVTFRCEVVDRSAVVLFGKAKLIPFKKKLSENEVIDHVK